MRNRDKRLFFASLKPDTIERTDERKRYTNIVGGRPRPGVAGTEAYCRVFASGHHKKSAKVIVEKIFFRRTEQFVVFSLPKI